jgi:rifampicin phosphotransferase
VVLDRLHRVNDDVATALEAWLTVTGNRPVDGFDIADPTGIEIPAMMVSCIRNALAPRAPEVDDAEVDRVRALVPADRRDDFDDRLAEARHCYRIRDERGIYSDALACGIVRRALLATGRRLERRGRLPRAVLAIDATIEELVELLDAPDPSLIAVLEDRALFRSSLTISDAPPFLGEPPGEPPSFDALPEHAARMMKALVGVNANDVSAGTTTAEPTGERVLQGVPASPGIHRGVARVVLSPDDLDRLEEGDVLVTITTGEAFNIAIAMVSALVTDQGSLMSHAGITAREYGIPAVVGASAATTQIPDGAVIEVDGSAGTIRWT